MTKMLTIRFLAETKQYTLRPEDYELLADAARDLGITPSSCARMLLSEPDAVAILLRDWVARRP